jgi:HPt (histidine-containing phosphotransfer) domain-containing protein
MTCNHNDSTPTEFSVVASAQAQHFCDVALKDLRHKDLKSGTKLYQYALQIYLADASPLLNRIVTGIATRNYEQVRRAAHSLKSNSLLVGALKVAAAAGVIEQKALEGDVLTSGLGHDLEDLLNIASGEILTRVQASPR